MADIFISYAREDRTQARAVALELTTRGWSVFWDRQIPPGVAFDEYIERHLSEARVVLVLWSPASVASAWVKNEASQGKDRTSPALVPAVIIPCQTPLAFRHLQSADLTDWRTKRPSEEFESLVGALDLIAPRGSEPRVSGPKVSPPKPRRGLLLAVVGLAVGTGVLAGFLATRPTDLQVLDGMTAAQSSTPSEITQPEARPKDPEPVVTVKAALCAADKQFDTTGVDEGYPGHCPKQVHVDEDEYCDYCRVVGTHPDYRLWCTKGTKQGLTGITLESDRIDPGYANECEWIDSGGGVPAFKRVVGNNHELIAITPVFATKVGETTSRPK